MTGSEPDVVLDDVWERTKTASASRASETVDQGPFKPQDPSSGLSQSQFLGPEWPPELAVIWRAFGDEFAACDLASTDGRAAARRAYLRAFRADRRTRRANDVGADAPRPPEAPPALRGDVTPAEREYLAQGVGAALRQARVDAGLSRRVLAERAGTHKATVAAVETGISRPRRSLLAAYAAVLAPATPDELTDYLVAAAGPSLAAEAWGSAAKRQRRAALARPLEPDELDLTPWATAPEGIIDLDEG